MVTISKCMALVGAVASLSSGNALLCTSSHQDGPLSNNTSSIWLHSNKENKKRKCEENGATPDDVTLCWPNAPLRECKEVAISRELYTYLNEHHVAGLTECFCVTEGFDVFESETREPLFVDGTTLDEVPLHLVSRYSGAPLPHLDMTFLDSSSASGDPEDGGTTNTAAVCWPNPLLGECKEAEISYTELNELLAEESNGGDYDMKTCSCLSEGFDTTIKKYKGGGDKNNGATEEGSNGSGVETYYPSHRATMCSFSGMAHDNGQWWETDDGGRFEMREVCKQFTIPRALYDNAENPGGGSQARKRKRRFNDNGVFECKGGCVSLGYRGLRDSIQQKTFQVLSKDGRRLQLQLIHRPRVGELSPGEWVYTYTTNEYTPRVTLCFFQGHRKNEESWWEPKDGGVVRKRELCNQVTINRDLYVSKPGAPGRQEKFNAYGIYECEGGCDELGYTVLEGSVGRVKLRVQKYNESEEDLDHHPKKKKGRPSNNSMVHTFLLMHTNSKEPPERVSTYSLPLQH